MVQAEERIELPDAVQIMGHTTNMMFNHPGSEEGRSGSLMNTHTARMMEVKSVDPPEDANQIEVARRLIAKTKTDKVNPLAKKN